MSAKEMFVAEHISVNYGKSKVITDVSFSLRHGEIMAVLGRNGVGKTTLMKCLIGLLPAEAGGRILIDGKDLTGRPAHVHNLCGIGYVPQGREIIPDMSVAENLALGAMGHGEIDAKRQRAAVLEYFPALVELLPKKGGLLSGGQQQQLAIARCLMGKPSLILLDEPTEGIQPNIVAEIAGVLKRIVAEMDLAVCMVEQNIRFARRLADACIILQKGRAVFSGRMRELSDEEANRYLAI
jgi:urea transport system ATP-binding protein